MAGSEGEVEAEGVVDPPEGRRRDRSDPSPQALCGDRPDLFGLRLRIRWQIALAGGQQNLKGEDPIDP